MKLRGITVLAAFLLFAKDYGVTAQYATLLDYLSQATSSIARPTVQGAGQYILPAIIQPILSGYDSCTTELAPAPSYGPNYGSCLAPYPAFPPIIINEKHDILHHLLYFLIFAMRNKGENYYNKPPSYGGTCGCKFGCGGSNNCRCSCDCPYCNKNNIGYNIDKNSNPTYIPIPVPIPVYPGPDGCRYIEGFSDDIFIEAPVQPSNSCNTYNGREANEIVLTIKTE